MPSGALGGEAVLACMERRLNIIAVKNQGVLDVDNKKLMYPKTIEVNNYFEAAGILLAAREGINHKSIKRPLLPFKNSRLL